MSRFAQLSILFIIWSATAQAKSCYYPDGTNGDPTPTNRGTVPCNITATNSACCDPWDSCTTSGLCLGASGWIYRSGCTDPTWQAPECSSLCQNDPVTNVKYSSFAPIYPCPSVPGVGASNFCCASSSGSCCKSSFQLGWTGFAFKNGTDGVLAAAASSASIAATASPTSSSVATVTITATATATAGSTAGVPLGTAIGAGVGVPLGVLAVGLLTFLVWRERRSRGNQDVNGNPQMSMHGSAVGQGSVMDPRSAWGGQSPMSQPTHAYVPMGHPGFGGEQVAHGSSQYAASEIGGQNYAMPKFEQGQGHVVHEMT